jgi:hypothetical protein
MLMRYIIHAYVFIFFPFARIINISTVIISIHASVNYQLFKVDPSEALTNRIIMWAINVSLTMKRLMREQKRFNHAT